jgi:hypothetical protein
MHSPKMSELTAGTSFLVPVSCKKGYESKETGYADETALHFELVNGRIVKEIRNSGGCRDNYREYNQLCKNCPHANIIQAK